MGTTILGNPHMLVYTLQSTQPRESRGPASAAWKMHDSMMQKAETANKAMQGWDKAYDAQTLENLTSLNSVVLSGRTWND